jgi:hypothetical protein
VIKRPPAATILTYFVYAALAAVVTFAFFAQQHRIALSDERYDDLFSAYQQLDRDCATAEDCETDAPSPSEVQEAAPPVAGAQGDPGTNGRDGEDATDEQTLRAVTRYCAENGCRGLPGADGAPGADGTPGRDGASITGPPGPSGANGSDGTAGENGQPGADGTPGAPGADGAPGATGEHGVGLASVTCVLLDDLNTALRFTFTNGTTNDVQALCTPPQEGVTE